MWLANKHMKIYSPLLVTREIYHGFNYVPLSIHVLGTSLVVQCNEPCNAGDMGSIPGQGTKIPHAEGQ